MIFGAHVILYSKDAAADRAFLKEVLGFSSLDAGHGWLIFALPPAEVAVHPADDQNRHELYFMCDDLTAEISALREKGVQCSPVQEARWGSVTQSGFKGEAKWVCMSPSIGRHWRSHRKGTSSERAKQAERLFRHYGLSTPWHRRSACGISTSRP